MADLAEHINWSACECLNRTSKSSIENVLKQGLRDQAEMVLESDADEQLLLTITFNAQVRLHSLQFSAPEDGRAPKEIKLFANRDNLDFEGAEDLAADQDMEFGPSAQPFGERLELGRGFVKFQKLNKLIVFVKSNQGDEESSAISGIKLWGATDATTNMKDFKRVAGEAGEGTMGS